MRSVHVLLLIDAESYDRNDPLLEGPIDEAAEMERHIASAIRQLGNSVTVVPFGPDLRQTMQRLLNDDVDLVFNATEWALGTRRCAVDIAGFLELIGIPFTGTASRGIAFSLDKVVSKELVRSTGVDVPKYRAIDLGTRPRLEGLSPPVIVKPRFDGGSEGLALSSLVHSQDKLVKRVKWLHNNMRQSAVCEEFVEGREISVAVIGGRRLRVLPIRETVFSSNAGSPRFMTMRAKSDPNYRRKWGIRYSRADLPTKLTASITSYCKAIFRRLELHGYGRIDLRVSTGNQVFFLEANHNPDLSPFAFGGFAKWAGMEYVELIQQIIDLSFERHRRKLRSGIV